MVKNPQYLYKNLTCQGCEQVFNSKRRNKNQKYCTKSCAAKHSKNSGKFQKGMKSWNAGKNISGMSGRKHTRKTKQAMRQSSLGEKASNWKGGISEENHRIRCSSKYSDWRNAVFKRDNYTCTFCGARSEKGNRVRLEADHIKQFAFYPDLRFDIDNGRTLCKPCHRNTDTWGRQTGETFDGEND